ncbi:hypothetical protein [Mycolicibacterium sarraceniae]|nr:hypothetical protein [Mycolicibacterium sarraceniae]
MMVADGALRVGDPLFGHRCIGAVDITAQVCLRTVVEQPPRTGS